MKSKEEALVLACLVRWGVLRVKRSKGKRHVCEGRAQGREVKDERARAVQLVLYANTY
jgi:hypothetical protein